MQNKKLYIKTYGCQMNAYDSVRMADVLKPLGFSPTDTPEGADMVILNTCHIREKAEEKVYSDLGRVRAEKTKNKNMLIAVGGCVAQAEGEEVIRRAPYVDMVFGSQAYHQLPELVTRAVRDKGGVVALDFPTIPKFDFLPQENASQGPSAFLAVQEGCDKFCTFCVVPYTRGAEYSRTVMDLEAEARRLMEGGAVEIMLLGQNVNAYHGLDERGNVVSLAGLIRRLSKLDGLKRIRYTTSHPRDMSEDLMIAHAEIPQLMPYLHLPVQAGSDKILKAMNRKHTAAEYIAIIERMRSLRPDIAFSGDFIVGFPGETEADFEETTAVVRHVGYGSAYSFKYSPRPGTPAATEETQVPEDVKDARLQRLQALITEQAKAFNSRMLGQVVEVLFERAGKHEGQLVGRSPWMQSVHVTAPGDFFGQVRPVKITAFTASSLAGEIIDDKLSANDHTFAKAAH